MEKAILKTLIYANLFNYPLKGYEILKWLIEEETTLIKVEKALNRLLKKKKIQLFKDYYFLKSKKGLIATRKRRYKYSQKFLIKTKLLTQVLKIIPWIKLVGISGGLAVDNSGRQDDIDLFLITDKNRLWISRILVIGIFDFLRVRRKVNMKPTQSAGKFCLNTILDEDHLEQIFKDLYTAHEVLQMKILWEKDGIYSKYLEDNDWVFKFLPNWTTTSSSPRRRGSNNLSFNWIPAFAGMTMERVAKWIQLKLMKESQGMERIEEGGLYFHPLDYREKILKTFKKKTSKT